MWLQLFVFHSSSIFSDEMLLQFSSQALSEPQGVTASIIFLLICGTKRKKQKKRNVLAREVGIIIQSNNKRKSKHPEIKRCSQLNKCNQNWKHKKSAEDSLANKMVSGLSVFLAISCPARTNSFSVKVCLFESIFFDSLVNDKFISALQVDVPEFRNSRKD